MKNVEVTVEVTEKWDWRDCVMQDNLTSSSLNQDRLSAVSTNQYSFAPPFIMLMLLMVNQPLRMTWTTQTSQNSVTINLHKHESLLKKECERVDEFCKRWVLIRYEHIFILVELFCCSRTHLFICFDIKTQYPESCTFLETVYFQWSDVWG